MRILLLLLALVWADTTASAQWLTPRIEGGGSFSSNDLSIAGHSYASDNHTAYRAAGAIEMKLGSLFYIAPGISYHSTTNGYKLFPNYRTEDLVDGLLPELNIWGETATLQTNRLAVPINLGLRLSLGHIVGVSLEGGGYVAYALTADWSDGQKLIDDVVKAFHARSFSRFDYGVGASVALELWSLYLRAGTEMELSDSQSRAVGTKDAPGTIGIARSSVYVALGLRF